VIFPIDAPRVEAEELRAAADHEDDALLADDRSLWNARVSSKTDAEPGQRLRLAVDPGALYFFDPDSGASLTVGARATAAAV
jgi:multiple sugar transport system ATP-binding protein